MHRMPDYEAITPTELKERLERGERPELLDVREPWEFELARIEGSRLIPLSDLPARCSQLDRAIPIITVCRSGRRSQSAAELLQAAGFMVANLDGGIDRWTSEGHPLN